MTRAEAVAWANSKVGQYLDFDGKYGTQCVDFFNFYYQYLTGHNPYNEGLGVPYAYQLASTRPYGLTWVQNNPADKNQVPSDGDIVILAKDLPGSGNAGHVLVSARSDNSVIRGIDETPNSKVGARQYSWKYVVGWFVPNTFTVGGDEMIINADEARLAYQLLRGDGAVSDGEIAGTAGRRSWVQFARDAAAEVAARTTHLRETERKLGEFQDIINDLSSRPTNAEYAAAQAKLAEKVTELQNTQAALDTERKVSKIVYTENPDTIQRLTAIEKLLLSIKGMIANLFKKK